MPTFRIHGADRDTGQAIELVLTADAAEEAVRRANSAGIVVARVVRVDAVSAEAPQAHGVARSPAVERYLAQRSSRGQTDPISAVVAFLWDAFLFRRMVTPWLIRITFAILLAVTGFRLTRDLIQQAQAKRTITLEWLWEEQWQIIAVLVFIRVIGECYILFFQMNETLSDLRAQGRK